MQRRQSTVQHVINAVIAARLLNGRDVCRLFHNAHQPLVARWAAAIDAGVDVGDIAANRAEVKTRFHLPDRLRELFGVFVARSQDVEGQTLSCFAADSRQLLQLID